jgi:malonyl CoA-acyl carrier protein transacylase
MNPKAIAVVGLGGVLPDAPDVPTFWKNIKAGRYSITDVPVERWDPALYFDPDPRKPDRTYTKIGAWVREFEFEPLKWGIPIPPRVLESMDLTQIWAIAATHQALADYGYPQRFLDPTRMAVILGNAMGGEGHYNSTLRIRSVELIHALEGLDAFQNLSPSLQQALVEGMQARIQARIPLVTEDTMAGELSNIIAGRVANVFNFSGPNFVTDAACASSLAALQSSMEGLLSHQFDAVLTGGVDRSMGPESFVKFSKIGALSPDGSRPYADGANGFVMGEGAVIFLMKRLEDAEQAGDLIYAVIRGVGSSSDGRGKGITAPNPLGQQRAIERAWQNAGVPPASAGMIEGHGTSTQVGDVAEVLSLTRVFGNLGLSAGSIALGSVKSNIGHLKSASGAAGLLKTFLALHEKVIPSSANFKQPNPQIDFAKTPFQVAVSLRPWEKPEGEVRRAGVSSFGFGGTNFHVVAEEYVPGVLENKSHVFMGAEMKVSSLQGSTVAPYAGLIFLGADSGEGLKIKVAEVLRNAGHGAPPPSRLPTSDEIKQPERLVFGYSSPGELIQLGEKALKALEKESPAMWQALAAHGVFRGSGQPGKLAFLFPGQGSQYVNMLRDLRDVEPVVASTFSEADAIMTPLLGRSLTSFIYVEGDESSLKQAEEALRNTAITQPAVLTTNVALLRVMQKFDFQPDMVIGHSLGEYAALVAAGVLTFAEALEVVSARGREMARVSMEDNGCMAAVSAPLKEVEGLLKEVDGYVVIANVNSPVQSVIGGATAAVEAAIQAFQAAGYQAVKIPVSHAFHTRIVAPASEPLRQVIARMNVQPPRLLVAANVTGGLYPSSREEILDLLALQVASPVQFIQGIETLYQNGARTFVEVGPKRVLNALAVDILKDRSDVTILATNHPRKGGAASLHDALCGLLAAGYSPANLMAANKISQPVVIQQPPVVVEAKNSRDVTDVQAFVLNLVSEKTGYPAEMLDLGLDLEADLGVDTVKQAELFATIREHFNIPRREDLRLVDYNTLQKVIQFVVDAQSPSTAPPATNPTLPDQARKVEQVQIRTPASSHKSISGSVVVSGAGLGLPGRKGHVFQEDNIQRILKGESFIEPLPEASRQAMIERRVTRLEKSEAGALMVPIDSMDQTIKLAGQQGLFDPKGEFGLPEHLVESTDISTQLAIAAGVEALRDAGIPLVMAYKSTSTGGLLPNRWMLPSALSDETGVIFCSAFPGLERMGEEADRFYAHQKFSALIEELRDLQYLVQDNLKIRPLIAERINALEDKQKKLDYHFDRRFIFRVLTMGHSQFAEYIGARGPNTHVNAACASTTHALSIAEDWIRLGRCRRVIVIAGDDVADGHLVSWVGTGLLATGATSTEGNLRQAALPFDRRRNGMIMGMGAAALVVEAEDAVRERGMRGIAEILSTQIANSAFHGTRLDIHHVSQMMALVVGQAEERFGLKRAELAGQMIFMSHETYTPARGGSAAAEIHALRNTFGAQANQIVIANTKGFTGHTMGVGVEDVVAVKALQKGVVPPIANLDDQFEPDPELGDLNLSRGGSYPVRYALRLGAGFGSQIALALFRAIPGMGERVDKKVYQPWLNDISGYPAAELEVQQHTLRIRHTGIPARAPIHSRWQYGQGPSLWADAPVENLTTISLRKEEPLIEKALSPVEISVPTAESVEGNDESEVREFVLQQVSEKTGYPPDMLDLGLDLEADLGIDTVKQAELFAVLREHFGIPRREDLRLASYNTLQKVINFLEEARGKQGSPVEELPLKSEEKIEAAPLSGMTRRVPVPVLLPRLELCKPTSVTLSTGKRVLIVADKGKVAASLARKIRARGVEVVVQKSGNDWNAKSFKGQTMDGIYFLSALDEEPPLKELREDSWQERIGHCFLKLVDLMQAFPNQPFLVCATRCGGLNGYGPEGNRSPLGGLVSGFVKSLAWERPQSLVKAVDFAPVAPAAEIATRLLEETCFDPAVVEVGWEGLQRFGISLAVQNLPADAASDLPKNAVFLVSGGSAGIMGPVLMDLARNTRGNFYLLGRNPLPEKSHPDLVKMQTDRQGFKKDIQDRLVRSGEKPSPVLIEEKLVALERSAATLRTMDEVRSMGACIEYIVCDVTDPLAVENAVAHVLNSAGRIDVLLHAAGVERSRRLESKSRSEIEQTLAVKGTGFFHLYRALANQKALPGHILSFSSVAGRFGNAGQTDYGAANDLLCRLASAMRQLHPEVKVQVIDWGPWAEVGMASRGHIPELMKRSGIEMLSPSIAASAVYRELAFAPAGEVVLAGSLGALEAQHQDFSSLDLEKANTALTAGKPIHVMLSRVTGYTPKEGVLLEVELDPSSEPFLRDHAMNGVPLLPGVMGIEGFSVAAQHISSMLGAKQGSFRVSRLENIQFQAPFKFYHNQPRRVTWRARAVRGEQGLIVGVTLESTPTQKNHLAEPIQHFSGKVYLQPVDVPVDAPMVQPPQWGGAYTVQASDIYRLYFHGPAFQVLDGVQRSGDHVLGLMRSGLPPMTNQPDAMMTSPLLLELVMQTAGIWEAGATGVLALPSFIKKMVYHRLHILNVPIFADVVHSFTPQGGLCFDARVVDGEGRLYLELEDYRTSALPYSLEPGLLAPILPLVE